LKGIVPDGHHLEFPETEHVHFYGFYIGNFPDLNNAEIDFREFLKCIYNFGFPSQFLFASVPVVSKC
jgi:hypothetical protein